MTNFVPIFPLNIVVFPGETLNLHIFEPRYKQLIKECFEQKKLFGIPSVLDNKMQEFGCSVEILEITKTEANGEMDIRTQGRHIFRVLEVIKEIPGKLYMGAIVNYPATHETGNAKLMDKVMNGIKELHTLLNVKKEFTASSGHLKCFDVAHHIGLSMEQEYELLILLDERQRQEYLKRHLAKAIPMAAGLEQLKEKVKLNGHFKNLSGFKFDS